MSASRTATAKRESSVASADTDSQELPTVLLLGGLGMLGIHILKYLVDFHLAEYIRVVDKRVPAICDLAPVFLTALASPEVEFMQADVSVPRHIERTFAMPSHLPTREGTKEASSTAFTIIINAAAETGHGYLDAVYEQNILEVRQRCAAAASAAATPSKGIGAGVGAGCECYVEVSSAEVYDCGGEHPTKPATEAAGVLTPWTTPARYHLAAEQYLQSPACASLPWLIVRLPTVYGPADKCGLMPRIACAATYARTGEKMELLWGSRLRVNTVHAQDAASAIWHLACTGHTHEVYNICDDGDTSQGSLNALLGDLFGIRTGFYSQVMSKIAGARIRQLAEEANAGHIQVWNEMLREAGIAVTCISPYVEAELLANKSVYIDNSKLKALGFTFSCPRVTKELLQDAIEYWTAMRLFPPREVIYRVSA